MGEYAYDPLDKQYKQAQISNIYSDIADKKIKNNLAYLKLQQDANGSTELGTLNGKPQNVAQTAANGYADRIAQADVILGTLGNKFTGKFAIGGSFPNALQSGDRQAYEQAKKNFATAVLRRESGASISPTEFITLDSAYFPQPGDKPDVLKNKESLRNTVINNFYREANVARPVLPGMIVEANGKHYKVGLDGESLEEVK